MSPAGPYRSVLFVPGHKPDWAPKAVAAGADAVVLDLEDSVPHAEKARARACVMESILGLRERAPDVGLWVRPNGLQTGLAGFDLEAVVSPGVDGLFLPKVESTLDVLRYETLSAHFERANGAGQLSFMIPIETAAAITQSEAIAASSTRVCALVASTAKHADIARAIGYRWTPDGVETLYHRCRALISARAAGVQPITGLWDDVRDLDGLRTFSASGRQLGFTGQIVIHPSHVAVVNDLYGADPQEIAFYEGLVEAFEQAELAGDAAVVYEGEHIDQADVETARERLALVSRWRS